MRLTHYVNYYIQWITILLIVVSILMIGPLEHFFSNFETQFIGIIGLLVLLALIGLYQLAFSFVHVLVHRLESIFRYHFLGSFLFFGAFALFVWLVNLELIDESFFDKHEIFGGILFFTIPIGLFVYFCFITFMKLNPYKQTRNEEN